MPPGSRNKQFLKENFETASIYENKCHIFARSNTISKLKVKGIDKPSNHFCIQVIQYRYLLERSKNGPSNLSRNEIFLSIYFF